MNSQKFSWYMVVIYMAVIFAISHQSQLDEFGESRHMSYNDKFYHVFEFGILGFLLLNATLYKNPMRDYGPLSVAILIGILYGALDEFHQSFVVGRNADFADWIADIIGVITGVYFFRISNP